ncbi:MAG: type I-E CRISPR-associated protein Cas6/Cse3/CasE [Propionibacteriaceae bacterium]
MPFLASVPLNPLRSGAQRLLSNPQRMHAAVEGALPPERSGRLLWRVEHNRHAATLFISSPDLPSLQHLVEQAGWPDSPAGAPRVADLAPLLGQLAIGREFHFRVRLNPVQHKSSPDGRSVRLGHRTLAHQLRWFTERTCGDGASWGFSVSSSADIATVQVVERDHLRFTKTAAGVPVVIDTATFQGILTVTDVATIRNSILSGIGSAKSYGCGLLTLAPPPRDVVAR